ncbi:MAG: tetratricopeptide repeat protein [Myxococcota bacterium]
MNAEDYQRAYDLFCTVADLPPARRSDALAEACGDDPELLAWVLRLLEDDNRGATFEEAVAGIVTNVLDQPPAPLHPGSVVSDRFEILEALGHGGAASVWKVRDRVRQQQHALKVLHTDHPSLRARMAREQVFQDQVRHRNVVAIHELVDLSGRPGLLLELVDGPDLATYLRDRTPTEAQIDALAAGILAGLKAIHDAGVIHRDIKPSNVLLAREGRQLVPKVADFGIARSLTAPVVGPGLTQTGALVGTLAYMAPEQIRDPRRVGRVSDVWSVGCLLYRVVAGRDAFGGRDNGDVISAVLEGRLDPLPESLPGRWRVAIAAALHPDPKQRPDGCAALLELWEAPHGTLLQAGRLLADHTFAPAPDAPTLPVLPIPPNRFIGRTKALEAVATGLQQQRLVTVLGIGGLGKTRLALEFGIRHHTAFQSVMFISLADAKTLDQILSAMATGLGLPTANDPSTIGGALARRGSALLILDNFEQLVEHAPTTVKVWLEAAPTLRILATSRAPLGLYGERCYQLELLTQTEAIELFIERAGEVRSGVDVEASANDLAKLVDLLDRLPLAIELAAARSRMLAPAALLERMTRRFEVLRTRTADVPARQRTLWATLQWSWGLLREVEQSTLAQLSIFEGGIRIDAAEAIVDLGSDGGWVEDVLAELVDKSLLITADDGRLRMLVSVQAFASEHLTNPDPVAARHGSWFARFGEGTHPTFEQAREHDNFVVATLRAVRRGDEAIADRCGSWAADGFIDRGPLRAGIAFAEEFLAAVTTPRYRVAMLRSLGTMLRHSGSGQRAVACLKEAVSIAREVGAEDELMRTLVRLGDIQVHEDPAVAEVTFTEAWDIAQRLGSTFAFVTLGRLAVVAYTRGDMSVAEAHFLEAIQLGQTQPPSRALTAIMGNLGNVHYRRNEFDAARRWYARASEMGRRMGDLRNTVYYESNLGLVAIHQVRFADGLHHFETALKLAREMGAPNIMANVLTNIGGTYRTLGQYPQATAAMQEALSIGAKASHFLQQTIRTEQAHLLWVTGQFEEAEAVLQDLLTSRGTHLDIPERGQWFVLLGLLHLAQGRTEEAEAVFLEGYTEVLPLGDDIRISRLRGLWGSMQPDVEMGRAALDEAEARMAGVGDRLEMASLRCVRATAEARWGDTEAAQVWLARAQDLVRDLELKPESEVQRSLQDAKARIEAIEDDDG